MKRYRQRFRRILALLVKIKAIFMSFVAFSTRLFFQDFSYSGLPSVPLRGVLSPCLVCFKPSSITRLIILRLLSMAVNHQIKRKGGTGIFEFKKKDLPAPNWSKQTRFLAEISGNSAFLCWFMLNFAQNFYLSGAKGIEPLTSWTPFTKFVVSWHITLYQKTFAS